VGRRLFLVMALFIAVSSFGDLKVSSDDAAPADAALQAKKYSEAKELYRQAYIRAKQGEDASRALFGVIRADYGLRNYYEACINLKRFFKLYPKSSLADEAHLMWGLSSLRINKLKEAEIQLNLVGGEFLQKARIAKAELEFIKDNIEAAEKLLAKLGRDIYESDHRVIYLRAMILSKHKKHSEAIQEIDKIPEQVIREENIAVSKAIIYYNARRYGDAKGMLNRIVGNPGSTRVEIMHAKRALFDISDVENNDDQALALALELLAYESSDKIKLKIVSLYDKKGDIDNALRYITSIRDRKVMSAEMEKKLKKLSSDKHPRLDEYISRFYVYLDPDNRYLVELSKYMTEKGNNNIAERMLRKALKGRAGAEAAIFLGGQLVEEKKYAAAKKILQSATMDPNYSGQASLLMSRILESEGDNPGASSYRQRAIRVLLIQKDYFNVGELYMRSGNRTEALKNYLKAADKGNVEAMIKSADLLYVAGKTGRAKGYYKKAIEAGINDPKSAQWVSYQYGKLTGDDEYLDKSKAGGGVVAEVAEFMKASR